MQQLTIQIPDNKMAFFIELANSLGFQIEQGVQKNILTQEQIDIVNEERKKIKNQPDHFLDWDEARKSIKIE